MAGSSRVSGAVGADPGPSTGDYGHNRGADPGPLLSYEQGIELRIGSVNVGTLRGRCGEVVDMVGRRKLDICCLQETRWKGGSSRTMGKDGARYKLFWVGSENGGAGVGVLVAEKWVDSVIDVKRVSERLLVLRLAVGKVVLNIVCVYAPQAGRAAVEKEEFLAVLGDCLRMVNRDEELIVCGDMNCHVGSKADGFESVHGGKGFGSRNADGIVFLDFAVALGMAVVNTWFVKKESQKISFESGGNRTTVDYVMVRREDLSKVKDMKVVPGESCVLQHRLLVCVLKVKTLVKRRRKVCVSRRKVWKLKEASVRQLFKEQFSARVPGSVGKDVDDLWNGLKVSLLDTADEVCGSSKGSFRHKESWWWSADVSKVVEEKRKAFKVWRKSGRQEDREGYQYARRVAGHVIAAAQAQRRKQFAEDLVTAEGKGKLFRSVKQMVKRNADVVGGNCVRNKEGKIVTEEEQVKIVWKDHFEKLLNEEFEWNHDELEHVDVVSGPCEQISVTEVRRALQSMKVGKAAGPSGVTVEMLDAAGEEGLVWITELFNVIVRDGKLPDDWSRSWMVKVYKGKGDALDCDSYRGIKLLDQVMKVFERVFERRLREKVVIDNMQFGFQPGRGTTDAIFIVRQVQEKFLAKGKELWMAFVDLEKAFDRVPREVLWWALRRAGVEEWIVSVIKVMYDGACTSVKLACGESAVFGVNVGVHQGSVLSPLLFTIVLDVLSKEFREGLPWELLYADDLALIAETEEELLEKIRRWKLGMEGKGLKVNMAKTKVMVCRRDAGQVEERGKYPCSVCHKGVGSNSILCQQCKKWVHGKCSGVKGKLEGTVDFICGICSGKVVVAEPIKREFELGDEGTLEMVGKFCYLGDMVGCSGGAEEAITARVRCAWAKFRELMPILTSRGASLKVKGKIYKACVQSVLIYGSETWPVRVEDLRRLERTERMMIRWMCGVSLKDRITSGELLDRVGLVDVTEVVRRGRLRWFGHVERRGVGDWVSGCRSMEVEGCRGPFQSQGRSRKTWMDCVKADMKKLKLKVEDAQDRSAWRMAILGNRLTRAGTEQTDVKR